MPDAGLITGPALFASVSALLSTTIIGSVTVGSVLFTAALSGASYALNRAAAKKAARANAGSGLDSQIEKQIVKQALPLARIIYGRALVAGALCFYERSAAGWFYFGVVIADHEIDAIEQIRMGDRVITVTNAGAATSTPYFDGTTTYFYISTRNGTDGQLIDPILAADFPALPATFRQRGVAVAVLKMWQPINISPDLNRTLYGNSGQPAPLFLVRGKKVFDPRDPSQTTADKTTWKWSENPSLCAADFQTLPRNRGGDGASWSEIDLAALRIAANADDEIVARKDGTVEKRYTCNGIINLDGTPPSEVIQRILTSNMGFRVTSNGLYVFLSGVPRSPVWTVNDDSARGSMAVTLQQPLASRVNIVKSSFVSIDRQYQVVEGPELRSASYIAIDGAELPMSVELPFTNSQTTAQRLCNILMQDSRIGRRVKRRENLHAIMFDAADILNLETNVMTAINGQYMIDQIEVSDSPLEFDVSFKGYDPSVYLWTPATDERDFTIAPASL